MSIDDLRKRIEEVDASIVKLIAERVRIAEEIGQEKRQRHIPIEDRQREDRVLENVKDIARAENVNQQDIEGIYRRIITAAKGAQGIVVAFQGEVGAYSEEAAVYFFSSSTSVRPCESLEGVFKAVEQNDEVQFGIAPIENSLEGSISKTYDLLLDSELKVCGEIELKVSHCLIANPGATLSSIKRIYSHPQALGQCQAFIKHLGCELIPTYDTAGSVKMIKEKKITDGAAIAGLRAGEIYGMEIIARQIEDNPNNFTRFFILARNDSPPTGNDKTSVVFSVKHKPGALFSFLEELADRNINLTKIESRPTRQKPWEYNLYLDFEGHRQDKTPKEVLEKLKDYAIFIKVLGSYPKAR